LEPPILLDLAGSIDRHDYITPKANVDKDANQVYSAIRWERDPCLPDLPGRTGKTCSGAWATFRMIASSIPRLDASRVAWALTFIETGIWAGESIRRGDVHVDRAHPLKGLIGS
jgi:hypothetical protein